MTRAVDTFNRADSITSLGTASGGFTWTTTTGTYGISANQNQGITTVTRARAEQALGSTDHFAQQTYKSFVANGANQCNVCVRFDSGADTCYYGTIREDGTSTRIIKTVAGVNTTLVTATTSGVSTGDTVRLEVVGTALSLYKNGVLMTSVTDSSLTTGDRAGIGAVASAGQRAGGDNFDAAPLTIGSASASVDIPATIAGRAQIKGTASGPVTVTATAAGQKQVRGTASASIDIPATAAGRKGIRGTASMPILVLATAAGTHIVHGVLTAVISVDATGAGDSIQEGSAESGIGVVAVASGAAVVKGSGTVTIANVATASSHSIITGSASAVIDIVAHAQSPSGQIVTGSAVGTIVVLASASTRRMRQVQLTRGDTAAVTFDQLSSAAGYGIDAVFQEGDTLKFSLAHRDIPSQVLTKSSEDGETSVNYDPGTTSGTVIILPDDWSDFGHISGTVHDCPWDLQRSYLTEGGLPVVLTILSGVLTVKADVTP